jgi:hypothetical protein
MYINIDIKTALTCFGAITITRERIIRALLKQSSNNVNCNVNFKIVFKTVHLCISWHIKKF